ncbi:MAG TPA: glycosyltransferase, partial [Thermoanaerobaculia bacterium]|nr:glycosyltransferase [Thermoanaerobaculia bacterium]
VVAGRQGELDVVTAIAVLEHVADMRGALERIRDLLATDGVLIFETPVLSATGDNSVWFNSSLEHVFYPTQEGLEHLFQEVFGLPLIGREVPLVDYGSTFVGLAVRGAKQHQRLGRWFRDLLDTPVAELFPPRERRFRLFFDLVHAAVTGPEQVALLAELPASDFTPPLLQRLIGLWKSDAARVAALRQELAQARTGWSAGELALHQERLRASELGREVMRLTAEAAESARREAERTDEVNALGAEVADWRHQAERWQQRSVQLEGEGAQLAAQAGALEGRLAATERRAAELADQGARLAAEAREWELQTVQRESELAEVTARAEAEEARALAAEGREWTIYQMLGVRDFELEAAKARSRQLDTDLQNSQAELAMRGERIQQMLRSTSWRLSAPLRAVGDRTRTMVKRLPVRPGGLVWRALRSLYRLVPVPQRGKQRVLGYLLRRGLLAPLPAATADHPPVPPPALAAPSVVHLRLQPWPASQPLVSVVIPCFNYGRFAAAAVDSVLAQTFQDLEIIVVDGGSDDAGSLAALQELQRPKTTIHFREQRHMVGDNRNFGIARARGKYICCLDPDDLLRPTYLEKALYRLETEGHDVVSTWYERFGAEGGLLQLFDYPNLADMIAGNHVATCAVFRRELWEEAGGFVDTGRGSDYVYEDWRLWIRFATLGARIANLREPLLRYRVHPASLSQGAEVRALPAQREAILALEPAAVGEEAHRRSAERQRQVIEVEDALCNLLP